LGNHDEPIVIDLADELQGTQEDRRVSITELMDPRPLERDVRKYWAIQVAGLSAVIVGLSAIA